MVTTVRRVGLGGLATMAAVMIATAIWPLVATVVTAVLITVVFVAATVPIVMGARWGRRELAWRRELRTMPMLNTAPGYGAAAPVPMLHELRESA